MGSSSETVVVVEVVVVFVVEVRLETVRVESESVTELMSSVVVSVGFVECGVSDDDDVLIAIVCSVEGAVVVGSGVGEGERERLLEYGSMLIIIDVFVFFFFLTSVGVE